MKKLSAKQFRYALADIAAALQQQIEADCEGFPSSILISIVCYRCIPYNIAMLTD